MKVLVTGGSGFLGQELIYQLIAEGHEVTLLTRQSPELLQPCPYQILQWPIHESDELRRLNDHDVLINLAGENIAGSRWNKNQKAKIRRSRIRFTEELAVHLQGSTRLKHVLSASAIGYYGDRKTEVLNEDSVPGEGFLAEVCRDWENAALRFEKLGARIVLLRTGVVLGRNQGFLGSMEPLYKKGLGGVVGSGEQMISWIHIADWVRAVIHILNQPSITGPVNLVAPEPVSNASFNEIYSKLLRIYITLPVPTIAVKTALGEMSELALHSQNVRPVKLQDSLFKFQFPYLKNALEHIYQYEENQFQVFDFYQAAHWIPKPLKEVFAFFSDIKNLEKISPPQMHFRVINMTTPTITNGTFITHKLKIHNIPVHWQSHIEKWQPPYSFIDIQTKGPFTRWQHSHTFTELAGGTLIRDSLHYKLPMGCFGRLAAGWFVKKDIKKVFNFRRRMVRELLRA